MNTVAIKEDFEPDPMNSDIKKTTFNLVTVVLSAGTGWKGHCKRKKKSCFSDHVMVLEAEWLKESHFS